MFHNEGVWSSTEIRKKRLFIADDQRRLGVGRHFSFSLPERRQTEDRRSAAHVCGVSTYRSAVGGLDRGPLSFPTFGDVGSHDKRSADSSGGDIRRVNSALVTRWPPEFEIVRLIPGRLHQECWRDKHR